METVRATGWLVAFSFRYNPNTILTDNSGNLLRLKCNVHAHADEVPEDHVPSVLDLTPLDQLQIQERCLRRNGNQDQRQHFRRQNVQTRLGLELDNYIVLFISVALRVVEQHRHWLLFKLRLPVIWVPKPKTPRTGMLVTSLSPRKTKSRSLLR